MNPYPFLDPAFLEVMNEIGEHGFTKYGPLPNRRRDHRDPARVTPQEMARHSRDHFTAYTESVKHDHFDTAHHQLAAVAFNAMMEYIFSKEESKHDRKEP